MSPQAGRPEDHAEIRPQSVLAGIGGPDAVDRAARAIAADQVRGSDDRGLTSPVGDRGPDLAGILRYVRDRGSGHQRARGQFACRLPQQFLQNVLRRLLAKLGEPVSVVDQPQYSGEPGQLPPGQRRAEHDVLRPCGAQRRPLAQPADAPPAQVLHRPHVDGLAPRAGVRHRGARLNDQAANPPAADERRRPGQPGRRRRRSPVSARAARPRPATASNGR